MCENRKVNLTTGNPVVDAVGKMHFMGNVIPENWFKTVVSETGKVHLLAILVLSEIVYWYKPTEVRDEKTGDVRWKKKFEATDFLQKSYSALEGKFNASHKQIRDALITLERLGVVKRNLRNIETKLGKCPNVLYLELNPEALLAEGSLPGVQVALLDCHPLWEANALSAVPLQAYAGTLTT